MNNKIYHIALKIHEGQKLNADDTQLYNAIKSDEANKALLDDVIFMLSQSEPPKVKFNLDVDSEWKTFKNKLANKVRKRKIQHIYSWSSAAAIAILVSLVFVLQSTNQKQVYVAQNEVLQIILPDNSEVSLNKHSELVLGKGFNTKNRHIELRGEGFFNVTHNSDLAFNIELDNGTQVQVVGTQFNLRSYNNESVTDLQVLEGKVAFGYFEENPVLIVEKGNKAEFNSRNGKFTELSQANLHINTWENGQFMFDNTPLGDVLESFERYFNKDILYPKNTATLNYSGQFNEPAENDFAKIIALAFGWEYRISDTQIVFSAKK